MATPLVNLRLAEDLVEHYDALAERLGTNRTEVMRAALEQVRDANPLDEEELARFRAKKAKGKVKVKLGPDNVLKATRELALRTYGGGASFAAEGEARYRRGEGRKRREGESDPRGHKALARLSSAEHLSTGRPAKRPVRPERTRHLRAV